MGWWEDRVVPRLTEKAGSSPEITKMRKRACAGLHGRVLELGIGSGLNIGLYPAAVTSVAAVEPSDLGWQLSAGRRRASSIPIERTGLDGQALTDDDASFDAALSTLTLCTIRDASKALSEVRRVLRPGGALYFFEHGLAPDQRVVGWQRRLEPLQRRAFAGCHLTRHIPTLLSDAGLDVTELQEAYLPGPTLGRAWSYGFIGRAVRQA